MNIIRKTEDFNRGWYAGPIGWIEKDAAEFAVAIRSALFTRRHICFWAGAGIVAQSDPLAEWQEIQTKGKQFSDLVQQ
jgi:menaquinone-specific isochorismate synthase